MEILNSSREGLMSKVNIPFVNPELNLGTKVAIVGSSGTLRDSEYGDLINDHDEVIRFNRAPVENYENLVGAKTTLRVANNHVFANVDISTEGYTNSPKNFIKDLRNSRILFIGPDYAPWINRHQHVHDSNQLFLYDFSSMNRIKSLLNCNFPRNLLVGSAMTCLCILAGIKPHLFGFDTDPIARTHYYQQRPKEWDNINHNPSSEQKMLLRLEREEKIIIYR